MTRQSTRSSLIRLEAPIADLKAEIALLSWDADPVITLTRRDIAKLLERFTSGEIGTAEVEEWANLVECREDIRYEPGHENVVLETVHDLVNPELSGPLAAIAPHALSRLRL